MPRKTAKKEAASGETKTEGATRRSGRSVAKKEEPQTPTKEASRARRSSTAAQTAASVADSKSPKAISSSPAESRQKAKRESAEPRAKSARRAASRVNYKESDGEEENAEKKVDENFDSDEEFDESDSDEKSKPNKKGKAAKSPAKGRGAKAKGKGSRSRRGKSKKHSSDEEDEEEMDAIELSDGEEGEKPKESGRPSRGRKTKADAVADSEEKPKSRRSTRGREPASDEAPRKRPTRGVQAKKYAEDEDEIEEVDLEEGEGGRKRKRESVSESNKRLKSEEGAEDEKDAGEEGKEDEEKAEGDAEKSEEKSEPMEVDEADKEKEAEAGDEPAEKESKTSESVEKKSEEKEEPSETGAAEEGMESDSAKKVDHSESSEEKPPDAAAGEKKDAADSKPAPENSTAESTDSMESKEVAEATPSNEQKAKANQDSSDPVSENAEPAGKVPNDLNSSADGKGTESNSAVSGVIAHSKDASLDAKGVADKVTESIADNSSGKMHVDESVPTANGAHEPHTNSTADSDQYYPLPGRKYVMNAKLSPTIRQNVKDKAFGFVSYNLTDSSFQKEKLLNELNKLEAHIICLQEVSKPYYASVLEPSLDALGFKGVFSQPEDQKNGVATFYKTSIFRLSGQSAASLKQLIEKELEASSLDPSDKLAVKSHIQKCGHVFFTQFATVIGTNSLTVANVQFPPTDLSIHALEVSCLAREVVKVNSGTSKPFLLGGEFNMLESEAPYQLMRDGYLSNEMIEELMRRKDVVIPGKENAALVNLLWNSFQHPSSTLCSCYKSILDHEVFAPEQKTTSPDLLWYSSDSLYTIGVVNTPETGAAGRHFSLKAELAFSC